MSGEQDRRTGGLLSPPDIEPLHLRIRTAQIRTARIEEKLQRSRAKIASLEEALEKAKTPPPPKPKKKTGKRNLALVLSFLVVVCLPAAGAAWYLWGRATDQYASNLGFTVRQEEATSAIDILGGLSNFSSSSSASDTDVLYEFIRSQQLVSAVQSRFDLRAHYAEHYARDPLFALVPDASNEDLLDYWQRMVRVDRAAGTGLIEVEVLAFDPEAAQAIARAVIDISGDMINRLSDEARADAMSFAEMRLERAVEQLRDAREAVREFRTRAQVVDPTADVQVHLGLLGMLQQRLGDELIALDLLRQTAATGDPRFAQAETRIAVIESRIEEERRRIGSDGDGAAGQDFASLAAEFERLTVDLNLAEQTYAAALASLDTARASARRQSRYLALYLGPTLAETSGHPRRQLMLVAVVVALCLVWAGLVAAFSSLRRRRS